MTHDPDKDIWFPAKKYGIGWGLPVAWQGWVVLVAYLLLTTGGSAYLARSPYSRVGLPVYIFVTTAFLITICWKKGEKIRWRR